MTRSLPRASAARWAAALLALGVLGLAPGCDRNTAPYVPGEAPQQPDLSRIFPDSGEPRSAAEGARRTPVAQETSRAGSARGPTISGEIRLGSVSAPEGATLFVIARPKGATGGPPLAVLRVPSPRFPHAFELSQANVMIPSLRFDGEMDLSARLDVDGNAMTRESSDLEGSASGAHAPGATGVVITLQ